MHANSTIAAPRAPSTTAGRREANPATSLIARSRAPLRRRARTFGGRRSEYIAGRKNRARNAQARDPKLAITANSRVSRMEVVRRLRNPMMVVSTAMAIGFATPRDARSIQPGAAASVRATRRYALVVKMLYSLPKMRMSGGATMVIRDREYPAMPMNPTVHTVPKSTDTRGRTTARRDP